MLRRTILTEQAEVGNRNAEVLSRLCRDIEYLWADPCTPLVTQGRHTKGRDHSRQSYPLLRLLSVVLLVFLG